LKKSVHFSDDLLGYTASTFDRLPDNLPSSKWTNPSLFTSLMNATVGITALAYTTNVLSILTVVHKFYLKCYSKLVKGHQTLKIYGNLANLGQ